VTVFRISGSLGPLARPQLERLTAECLRRGLPRLVLDLSSVEALGGRTARLLTAFAEQRAARNQQTAFVVDSPTVRGFLSRASGAIAPVLCSTLEEAMQRSRDPIALMRAPSHAAPRQPAPLFLDDFGPAPAPPVRQDPPSHPSVPMQLAAVQELLGGSPLTPPFAAPSARRADGLAVSAGLDTAGDTRLDADADSGPGRLLKAVTTALHERGLASRLFVFEVQPDDRYTMLTRHGLDSERSLPARGAFCQQVRAQGRPALVFDLCERPLSSGEEELLAELNCEVVASGKRPDGADVIVFLSKEKAGDEYTLEELLDVDRVLRQTLATLEPVHSTPPATRRAPAIAPAPPPPAPRPSFEVPPFRPAARSAPDADPALRRKVTQMRDILRLSVDFDAAFGTTRILDVMVLSVVSLATAERVLYFARRTGDYRLAQHRGFDVDAVRDLRLDGDATLVRAVSLAPHAIRIQDTAGVSDEEKIWARQLGVEHAAAFRIKDHVVGLILFGTSRQAEEPDIEILSFLLNQAAIAYDRALLAETLQDRTLGVVRGLITVIESRNGWDAGSTELVLRYTQSLARELRFPDANLRDLIYGAVLRDVGMLRISDSLLASAQDLSADQWETIRRHPVEGAAIMRQMRFGPIAIDVVMHHHESYNGEGYPMGLRGRAIPLGARIVAVAEAFVKMTLDRPYRRALGRAEALESIAENWGLRYDPLVVDALLRVVNREMSAGLGNDSDLARDLFSV
jgi:HD-GYP domain-containing protein (c-di-GMP phosphodiesterase class II)/anti-anti-sigma regulatory factor